MSETAPTVQMIPVDQINVLNPRSRDKQSFTELVQSIKALGIKKPITVPIQAAPTSNPNMDAPITVGEGV